MPLDFTITARCGAARRGRLTTRTAWSRRRPSCRSARSARSRASPRRSWRAAGASIMLANLYHLALRPGIDVDRARSAASTLHRLARADPHRQRRLPGLQPRPTCARSTTAGVTFRSHLDGSPLRFTPEAVVDLQERMGVDIAMVLDECPPWPVDARRRPRPRWQRTAGAGRGAPRARLDAAGPRRRSSASSRAAPIRDLRERAAAELARARLRRLRDRRRRVGEPRGRAARRGRVDRAAACRPAGRAT